MKIFKKIKKEKDKNVFDENSIFVKFSIKHNGITADIGIPYFHNKKIDNNELLVELDGKTSEAFIKIIKEKFIDN